MHPLTSLRQPIGALAFAVTLALALPGCTPTDAGVLLADARQQHQRGQLRAAVIQLKSALRHADTWEARRLLGEVYLDQGDAASAEKELRRALGAAPAGQAASIWVLIGRAMLLQGQFEPLLREFGADAKPVEILALRGDALIGLARLDDAQAAYGDALRRQPGSADALLGLAQIALLEQRPDEADKMVARALASRPGHIAALRFRGNRLRVSNRPAEALAAFTQILAVRPGDPDAHLDIAGLHIDAGRFDQARAALAQARKAAGTTLAVHHVQAMLAFREGKLDQSLASAQQILRVAPDHPAGLLLAATVELQTGADEQAEQHLKSFLSTHPHDLYASKRMALLHLRANRADAALKLIEPLRQGQVQDVELLTLAGEAYLRKARYTEATRLFEQASALQPHVAQRHTELALGRLGSGELARATADLERAVQLDQTSERHGILLVMAHLRANAPDKALGVATGMERRADNPLIQNLKGGIYLATRDTVQARRSFERALVLDPDYLPALSNLAQLDMAAGQPDDAVRRYEKALAHAPGHIELQASLAGLAASRGRYAEAIGWLERALKAKPGRIDLALRLADTYVRSGQPGKALILARQLVAAHPGDADALHALADLQWQDGALDAAAATYHKLVTLAPTAAIAHVRLASIAMAQGKPAIAKTALKKALGVAPDAFPAQLALVNILVAEKKYAEALAFATAEQQRRPGSPGGFKLEADIQAAQGKHALALSAYERAYALDASGAAVMQLHATLVKLGQIDAAERRMTAWLGAHPSDVPTRVYYASSKMVANDFPAAIVQLDAVLKIDPANVIALNDIAWAHQRLRRKEALGYAERAYRLAPENASVTDTLGWIHLDNGDLARAVPLLRKAAALAPHSIDIRSHLAAALAGSGNAPGAPR